MQSTSRVLVVDDEADIRSGLSTSLEQLGFQVTAAASGEEAVHELSQGQEISCVITDYKMAGLNGFDVLKEVKKRSPDTPVVLVTGFGNVHHAVEAMQLGASDYLCKPFRFSDLERVVFKSMPQKSDAVSTVKTSIITENSYFTKILDKAKRVARSDAPVLIEGPSGTGKELLAQQIHQWSERKDRPWVAINCAALPSGLLESELFGFEKGAFTGAVDRKIGRFEQAHSGTLLLDEIGELDPLLQAKLLRVLQEGEVDRLGARKSQKVDVRLLATTNKNLQDLVRQGSFREDLYFRLYGVRFDLPSLNQRASDIPLLAEQFLKRQSEKQGRSLCFDKGVLEGLKEHSWPGNVRELEHAVERASILAESDVIKWEHFEFVPAVHEKETDSGIQIQKQASEQKSIREMEKEIILESLAAHEGNRTKTAAALGMSLRTLRHKLKQYREAGVDVGIGQHGKDWPGKINREPGVMRGSRF